MMIDSFRDLVALLVAAILTAVLSTYLTAHFSYSAMTPFKNR